MEVMLHDGKSAFSRDLTRLLDAFDAAPGVVHLMRERLVDHPLRRFDVSALQAEFPHVGFQTEDRQITQNRIQLTATKSNARTSKINAITSREIQKLSYD